MKYTPVWIVAGLALGLFAIANFVLQLCLLILLALGAALLSGGRPREAGMLAIAYGVPGVVLLGPVVAQSLVAPELGNPSAAPSWLAISATLLIAGVALVRRYRPTRPSPPSDPVAVAR